jgi:hypothetical protein
MYRLSLAYNEREFGFDVCIFNNGYISLPGLYYYVKTFKVAVAFSLW